ncbi:gpi anchored protein [Fusarium denticulatum]|uniref:Gpi anchored protein n=1 Tax=Fusarium denticulatum TaxID=48507 RepID=A0A8H5TQJ3_9HYPO|nr:gpi anchored protein [Fusarium denticulatum]
MRSSTLLLTALLCGISLAHFEVKYPETIGFKDDNEGESPCGGFTPDLSKDKLVDFHVGGEAIALLSTHQQGNWLFRVTLNEKADGDWEQVFPIVQQSGLGAFCQPQVTVPEKYAGKKGWVNVVSSAVDGLLYQCIAANFVNGKADPPSDCKNATSVKASFVDDDKLSALVGNDSKADSSSSGTASGTATSTGSAASSTSSDNAVAALQAWSANGVGMITLMTIAFAGGALLV